MTMPHTSLTNSAVCRVGLDIYFHQSTTHRRRTLKWFLYYKYVVLDFFEQTSLYVWVTLTFLHLKIFAKIRDVWVLGVPICSMCGISTYIWLKFMANVDKYSIHGAFGIVYHKVWPWLATQDLNNIEMYQILSCCGCTWGKSNSTIYMNSFRT